MKETLQPSGDQAATCVAVAAQVAGALPSVTNEKEALDRARLIGQLAREIWQAMKK